MHGLQGCTCHSIERADSRRCVTKTEVLATGDASSLYLQQQKIAKDSPGLDVVVERALLVARRTNALSFSSVSST